MISTSPVSSAPVSSTGESSTSAAVLIQVTSTLFTSIVSEEDILTRTERHILTFTAEIEPWVLTR